MKLSLLRGPSTDVQTSIGKVYLYPLRVPDVRRFEKLAAGEPSARLREFLPCIASLSPTSKPDAEREPLASELVAQFSDDEVEVIAEAYASSAALKSAREGSKDRSGIPRESGEMATAYLDRLLKKEVEDQAEQMLRMRKQMIASTSSIFDQVRKSSSVLTKSLTDYEKLSSASITPRIDTSGIELSNLMAEQHARQVRERAEELEMIRLTGQMTAQSATTLRDLAEAASTLLENLDERDRRSDRMTHIQLWIAVGSVFVAAVLSGAAFFQDRTNNIANDRWQGEVLSSINEGNLRRSTIDDENKRLKAKVVELSDAVSRLSAAKESQPTAAEAKSAASSARRVTSPGKTLPPP